MSGHRITITVAKTKVTNAITNNRYNSIQLMKHVSMRRNNHLILSVRLYTTTYHIQVVLSMIRVIHHVPMLFLILRVMAMPLNHTVRLPGRSNVNKVTINNVQAIRPRHHRGLVITKVSNDSRVLLLLRRNRRCFLTRLTNTNQLISSYHHQLTFNTYVIHTRTFT